MTVDKQLPVEPDRSFDIHLLANFVHQVVNPLNGVAGTLDNFMDGSIKGDRYQQRMRATRAQLEQCISLIRNLAYFSQGFEKLKENDRKKVVLPQVIIEAAMFYQEGGEDDKVRIALKDKHTANQITGQPDLIRQVLMNIFDNCVKYSEPKTEVEVHQRIQKRTGHAIITIKNKSRSAFGPEDAQKIFNLGYRGTNAKKVVASGSGLGMYICKKIVEDVHGGTIRVQITRGQEIELTITLPHGSGPTSRGN